MRKRIIQLDRSVVVACDVPTASECGNIATAVRMVPKIGAFKVGFDAGYGGLAAANDCIRRAYGEEAVIIFDHQKAGTDIPDIGANFAKKVREAGCNAAILFPLAGPATQSAWTKYLQDHGVGVLIGLVMTHPHFLVSEGGYIDDSAPKKAFELACKDGVRDFVVPGTKLNWVTGLKSLLDGELGEGTFDLYAPGLIKQGGDISECGQAAGKRFHGIVGSAIYKQPSVQAMREAAERATSKL